MIKFKTKLVTDPKAVGPFILVPGEVTDQLHFKGRPLINSIIAGVPYRGSLMPMGDGRYALGILKAIYTDHGLKAGDTIEVQIEVDTAPRVITPPTALANALAVDATAKAGWDALSYSRKREIAQSIEAAKKPETKDRRLSDALARLRSPRG
jgi:hypothetical protein